MDDLSRVRDAFETLSSSSLLDDRVRVLKDAETFAVFDRRGDAHAIGLTALGLYHEGTRHLSALALRLGGQSPLFLSSTVRDDNALLTVDLANPDPVPGEQGPSAYSCHLFRAVFLWERTCHQRFRVRNHTADPLPIDLSVHVEADFADVFEVRGRVRARRGRLLEPLELSNGLVLRYEGLDGVERRTRVEGGPRASVSGTEIRFRGGAPAAG